MIGAGDFFAFDSNSGLGDNRSAVFYWTGLSNLNDAACSECSNIKFGGSIISSPLIYMDEGVNCLAQYRWNLWSGCSEIRPDTARGYMR